MRGKLAGSGGGARPAAAPNGSCGGSEVRIICAATSSCGLLNQSHTRISNLLVSFDSEVRKGRRREMMRTSESGHWMSGIQRLMNRVRIDPCSHGAESPRAASVVGLIQLRGDLRADCGKR